MTVQYDPFSDDVIHGDNHGIYKRLRDESPVHYLEAYEQQAECARESNDSHQAEHALGRRAEALANLYGLEDPRVVPLLLAYYERSVFPRERRKIERAIEALATRP